MTPADLLTIGAFARLVGLTPSALRFYDDCGLLRPREIDPQTGYRYYGHDQRRAAELLRRARELDLPLADVEAVLAGPAAVAAELIRGHAATLGARAERSARLAAELIAALEAESRSGTPAEPVAETAVEVAGPELAAAIRQVRDAGEPSAGPPRGVLVELGSVEADGSGELAVVADGPAWLAVRTLPAVITGSGPARRLPVAGADAEPLAELARRQDRVTLHFGAGRVGAAAVPPRVVGDRERLELRHEVDLHPSYRAVFAGLAPWRSRVIMDRAAALAALPAEDSVRLVIDHDQVEFHGGAPGPDGTGGPRRLPAVCRGASLTVAFATEVLAAALSAGLGPDVLLESSAPDRPVLVRSADQGSFTLLIMPQRPLS
ncbi:MerR family transcriptional regulator [Microlunatus sp. GCM10028923]|uniref:MerR family transcriptional regulator n=1 Tax=Microlunatus sp. GCM10028923 TaxID=3273400 RepID=UPI00361A2D27